MRSSRERALMSLISDTFLNIGLFAAQGSSFNASICLYDAAILLFAAKITINVETAKCF